MSDQHSTRLLRAETLTAIGIFVAAAALLVPALQLSAIAALLPASMLIGLMVLSVVMIVQDQRKVASGAPADPLTVSPIRALSAFGMIVLYAIAVDIIGFYPSTALTVPAVAYAFGYRSPLGLATATAVVLGAIYLIFGLAMSRDFPTGLLWSM